MRDSWLSHNSDKLMLFILLLLGGYLVMHIVHHDQGDMQAMTWAEGAFSTVLGALILILTGRGPAIIPPSPSQPSSDNTDSNSSQPPSPPPPSKLKVTVP